MPFKETMYNKQGEEIDTAPFIFNIELDELETYNNAKLVLKPLDPCVVITREHFDLNNNHTGLFERVKKYETNVFYDDENDLIMFNIWNGFDVALFNICSLLGIGHVELDDHVPNDENGFAPIHDKVSLLKFTLEEFKQLDGFVAMFKFTQHFILFKGLLIGANYIHESVNDGDVVPDFKSNVFKRGEKLFLLE